MRPALDHVETAYLVGNAKPLKKREVGGSQRFADMKSGMAVLFRHRDSMPARPPPIMSTPHPSIGLPDSVRPVITSSLVYEAKPPIVRVSSPRHAVCRANPAPSVSSVVVACHPLGPCSMYPFRMMCCSLVDTRHERGISRRPWFDIAQKWEVALRGRVICLASVPGLLGPNRPWLCAGQPRSGINGRA